MSDGIDIIVKKVGKEIKNLVKKLANLNLGFSALREKVYMLEKRIDKIQAKKEVDYAKVIETLLNHIINSKDTQYNDYISVIKELISKNK